MQRSSVSIPSNIAEGDELNTQKQSLNFFYHARGSSAELLTQTIIAQRSSMINIEDADYIVDECRQISRMLNSLISTRKTQI